MSKFAKLPTKIKSKARKAVNKATNLIKNQFARMGETMSQHDRIVFDLKGYLVKPAVLSPAEIAIIKDLVLRQRNDPESLPAHERQLPGGAFAPLIDHPEVIKILLNVIDPDINKIRLENVFLSYREKGDGKWDPHAGEELLTLTTPIIFMMVGFILE